MPPRHVGSGERRGYGEHNVWVCFLGIRQSLSATVCVSRMQAEVRCRAVLSPKAIHSDAVGMLPSHPTNNETTTSASGKAKDLCSLNV